MTLGAGVDALDDVALRRRSHATTQLGLRLTQHSAALVSWIVIGERRRVAVALRTVLQLTQLVDDPRVRLLELDDALCANSRGLSVQFDLGACLLLIEHMSSLN